MSFETIRINELAKELGLTSKEVIEKFAQLSITGKTHSSTVTVDQVKRLKEFIDTLSGVERVEILPYHDYGKFKWEELGEKYELDDVKPPSQEEIDKAKQILGI